MHAKGTWFKKSSRDKEFKEGESSAGEKGTNGQRKRGSKRSMEPNRRDLRDTKNERERAKKVRGELLQKGKRRGGTWGEREEGLEISKKRIGNYPRQKGD